VKNLSAGADERCFAALSMTKPHFLPAQSIVPRLDMLPQPQLLSFPHADVPTVDVLFTDTNYFAHACRFGGKLWETKQATENCRDTALLLTRNHAIDETISSVSQTVVKEIAI
jgi:hypothetical protein